MMPGDLQYRGRHNCCHGSFIGCASGLAGGNADINVSIWRTEGIKPDAWQYRGKSNCLHGTESSPKHTEMVSKFDHHTWRLAVQGKAVTVTNSPTAERMLTSKDRKNPDSSHGCCPGWGKWTKVVVPAIPTPV